MNINGVYKLLADFSKGEIARVDFNRLVDVCVSLAQKQLMIRKSKSSYLFNIDNNGLSCIAIEAISPLFIQCGNNNYPIVKSFDSWEPSIKTNEDTLFFLIQIVSKRVEQHIVKMLKDNDPVFARILNNINYLIIKNSLNKQKFCGVTYILKEKTESINRQLLTEDNLDIIPSKLLAKGRIELTEIIDFIKENSVFYEAIPLYSLVHLIKSHQKETEFQSTAIDIDEKLSIDYFIEKALDKTEKKMKMSYVDKNKMTHNDYISFKKTLENIIIDMKNGGISDSLYSYLSLEIENLSKTDYHKKYRNKMEYMYKYLKAELLAEINSNTV